MTQVPPTGPDADRSTSTPAAPLPATPAEETAAEVTPSTTPAPPAPGLAAVTLTLRRALRAVLAFLGALLVLGIAIGAAIAGWAGVWGALIGVGVAAFFSGTTIVVMLRTVHASPAATAGAVMGSWIAKMAVLIVVLALMRTADFYDRWVFAVVLLVGVIGSALLDYRAVARGRVPYVDPAR